VKGRHIRIIGKGPCSDY